MKKMKKRRKNEKKKKKKQLIPIRYCGGYGNTVTLYTDSVLRAGSSEATCFGRTSREEP